MTTYIKIPANTLQNGITYNCQVCVFDYEDVASEFSNTIVVQCLVSPIFNFENVTSGMTIRSSYIDTELTYFQENGELLNEYTVTLYAANQTTVVYNSGYKYSGDSLTTRVTGLMDDNIYYLRATGETVNGMMLDTGLIEILCDYIKPEMFLSFRADNIAEEGSVRLSGHYVLVEGSSNTDELIYIDDEKISLLNGEKVYWDSGFSAKDFVWNMRLSNIPDFAKVITFNMKSSVVSVTWNYGYFEGYDDKMYYAELTASQYVGLEMLNYIQISNLISPLQENEQVNIWIRHSNGLFDIVVTPLSENEIEVLSSDITEGSDGE